MLPGPNKQTRVGGSRIVAPPRIHEDFVGVSSPAHTLSLAWVGFWRLWMSSWSPICLRLERFYATEDPVGMGEQDFPRWWEKQDNLALSRLAL